MKKSLKSALLSLDVSAEFNEIQLILCYQNYLSNCDVSFSLHPDQPDIVNTYLCYVLLGQNVGPAHSHFELKQYADI